MAGPDSTQPLRPSLIDRFAKPGGSSGESRFFEGIEVRHLKAEVAQNLEWILNTRVWMPDEMLDFANLEETRNSLINYGIPDLSIYSWANAQHCRKIAGMVENVIRIFEPRLLSRTVSCDIVQSNDEMDFSLKLRINATLQVDPISEHVTFDSSADFEGGGLRIERFE